MSPPNKHLDPSPVPANHMDHGGPGHRIQIKPCFSVPLEREPSSPSKSSNNLHPNKDEQKKCRGGKLTVGEGIFVLCEIKSCESLFVHGGIETSVECAVLKISETGEVIGDAIVNEADVYGLFKGDLTVKGCLTVRASGRVIGKISYRDIKIERGGRISG